MMNRKLITITITSLLAATVMSACNRSSEQAGLANGNAQGSLLTAQEQTAASVAADASQAPAAPMVGYADVTDVHPVKVSERAYGTVIASTAVTKETSEPKQVCADVAVEERLPERDGNTGGTVVGAVVGGLLGNQVGKGDGRKLATVAGAVAGGFAGHEIDKRHEGGQIVTRTEQQCHTETSSNSEVIGYDVSYREPDGSTGSKRMASRLSSGSRIALGSVQKLVGYDVTYSYQGETATIRMDHKPGDRLPVVDGAVVTASTSVPQG